MGLENKAQSQSMAPRPSLTESVAQNRLMTAAHPTAFTVTSCIHAVVDPPAGAATRAKAPFLAEKRHDFLMVAIAALQPQKSVGVVVLDACSVPVPEWPIF